MEDTGNKFIQVHFPSLKMLPFFFLQPSGDPDKSAFRTSTLVFPEAKSIYKPGETGNKYLQPSGGPDKGAFRNSPMLLAEAKTIYAPGEQGNKFLTPSGEPDKNAFRNAPMVLAEGKPLFSYGEQVLLIIFNHQSINPVTCPGEQAPDSLWRAG